MVNLLVSTMTTVVSVAGICFSNADLILELVVKNVPFNVSPTLTSDAAGVITSARNINIFVGIYFLLFSVYPSIIIVLYIWRFEASCKIPPAFLREERGHGNKYRFSPDSIS